MPTKSPLKTIFALTRNVVMFTLFASAAVAGDLFVDPTGNDAGPCLGPGPTACKTIQAAINKSANGDTIHVAAGTYPEVIEINDRAGLRIVGAGTSSVMVPPGGPPVPNLPLVVINTSKSIFIESMRVSGNGGDTEGFRVFYSTAIHVINCTVEGHQGAGGGFFVVGTSGMQIDGATIQDNGIGIRVDGNTDVSLNGPPFAAANSVVRRNNLGIQVRGGTFFFNGTGNIEFNNTGIQMDGGIMKACCENQTAPRKINGNVTGMLIRTGASVELNGPMEFIGNEAFAIRQFGSGTSIFGKVMFQTNGAVGTAVILLTGGQLTLGGQPAPNQIVIRDNPGTGILLTDNASLRMNNVSVLNNGVHGVRVQALSTAALIQNVLMSGNSGRDLSCAPNAFARGNNAGVNTQYCPGFDNSPDPHGP